VFWEFTSPCVVLVDLTLKNLSELHPGSRGSDSIQQQSYFLVGKPAWQIYLQYSIDLISAELTCQSKPPSFSNVRQYILNWCLFSWSSLPKKDVQNVLSLVEIPKELPTIKFYVQANPPTQFWKHVFPGLFDGKSYIIWWSNIFV